MADHDRDAILARRALLVSAALASLACTRAESPSDPEPSLSAGQDPGPPTVVVETPGQGPGQTQAIDGPRPAWAEVMAKAPPIEVPAGLTKSETEMLTYLGEYQRERYAKLAEIWSSLPGCGPSTVGCVDWAHAIEVLDELNPEDWGPLCGYSPEITHAYLERQAAHTRYVRAVSDLLLADLDAAVVARGNPADSAAWAALETPRIHGQPCLSCMMPTAEPVIEALAFGPGDASLSSSGPASDLLRRVQSIHERNRQQQKAKLIIRGHADPSEPDPEALAQQRAEAVAGALAGLGVNRKQLEVRSYGASLPITRDPAKAHENCRVDFEVVVP